mmetsp:Transcript_115860/g.300355  ORF Transcript_115860/g.300355 Transcript_115860/m.300355 type:complete len:531 (+) Transcript_115860:110-1702(+)
MTLSAQILHRAPAVAIVLSVAVAVRIATAEESPTRVRVSPALLSGDDSCIGSGCGVHLLQRKSAHLAAAAAKRRGAATAAVTGDSINSKAMGVADTEGLSKEEFMEVSGPDAGKVVTSAAGSSASLDARAHRPSGVQASRVAAAVVADELVGELPAVAVSFMQERIQHVSAVFPRGVHEALLGTAAAQTATALTSLTAIVLLARCVLLCREKRRVHVEANDFQHPLDASTTGSTTKSDDLCPLAPLAAAKAAAAAAVAAAAAFPARSLLPESSMGTPSSAGGGSSGSAAATDAPGDASQAWLCPELLVPKRSRCIIAVPILPPAPRPEAALATPTVARVVTDRVGQPLFRTCVSRLPKRQDVLEGEGAETGHTEQLTIARHDGTCLAECHLHLPDGPASRKRVECNILQRDGQVFACLRQEHAKVSWISQVLRMKHHAAPESTEAFNFVSAASPAAWQLRVQGNPAERKVNMVDGMGRTLATVDRSTSFGFDTRGQEFYRVETNSELDTDLGLVTLVLLAMDRVLTTCSS